MKRRDFLRTAGMVTAGSGLLIGTGGLVTGCAGKESGGNIPKPYKVGGSARMRLSFEPYELKLRHTFTVATYSRTTTPDVQVKIEYDGFTGYGEASMPPYLGQTVESVCNFLKKVDLGQFSDPFQIDDILTYVDGDQRRGHRREGRRGHRPARPCGSADGQPWYRIWGLNAAKAPDTTFTIGIDTPDVVREKTKECAGQFNILKVKVGLDNDKEMIETIREITDLPLAVDANQGWKDREKALEMIHWLKDHGVVMVEQPMPKEMLDDNAWLTEKSPLPTFADEAIQRLTDVQRVKGAYSGINIKLMKCTGMREAWKMLNYARAEGMKVMVGCMTETSCAVTAAAQLSPAVDFADLDGNLLIANDRFEGMTVVNGKITLPDRPGLGLKLL